MGIIIAILITMPVAYAAGWVVGVKRGVRFKKEQWVDDEIKSYKQIIEHQISNHESQQKNSSGE